MEERYQPEPTGMPCEYVKTIEPKPDDLLEFAGRSGGKDTEQARSHSLLKKLMFVPLASAVAVVSIVFASFGYDPLGDDFLNQDVYEEWEDQEESQSEGSKGQSEKHSHKRTVREYPGDLTDAVIHVTYMPTGDEYRAEALGEEGLEEAREWVKRCGGDPESLSFVSDEEYFAGYDVSDDAIIVGDLVDDPDHAFIAQGTVTKRYKLHVYYEAYGYDGEAGDSDAAKKDQTKEIFSSDFPELSNLEPDWEGQMSWTDYGPELYLYCTVDGEPHYLVSGEAIGQQLTSAPGISYDRDANTLTLDHFTGEIIEANLMGNGFTIRLIGENHVEKILLWGAMYGGSVTFTGDGNLILNESRSWEISYALGTSGQGMTSEMGLKILAEGSESCVMIESGVTLEIHGEVPICVEDTFLEEGIFVAKDMAVSDATVEKSDYIYVQQLSGEVHMISVTGPEENILRIGEH